MEKMYDIQEIMNVLPHRYPFILVDRILELIPGEKVVALKNVTINEPFFQGHFPGTPVMPGVLIVEAMAQAGAVLAYASLSREESDGVVFFMGMDKVKFRKPVVPGDQLIIELKPLKQRLKVFKMSATAKVDETLVAEAELMATFGEKP
ncbi:3-hydroxyacyl-ACP dehydratase FabZ [Thermodesulfobacteriota bacterium]